MKCVVDEKCPDILKNICTVQMSAEEGPYTAILNKYDPVDHTNKCRIIQLLNRDNQAHFIYTRSGKLDAARKETIDCLLDLNAAIAAFQMQFYEFTGIAWHERLTGTAVPGKYNFIVMKYNIEENIPEKVAPSFAPGVESLITRIFDINLCRHTKMQIDEQKLPLGMLSLTQIKKAYEILREALDDASVDITERYYSTIPTSKDNTVILDTREKIQNKLDFLGDLENMYYIGKNEKLSLQYKYLSLKATISPVEPGVKTLIEQYLTVNQGYHMKKLKYVEAFAIDKQAGLDEYSRWESLHNKQLLWHGTAMANVVGIITNGLCLNPIAPVAITGKMFGKGLYFANVSTKSAGYIKITSGIGAMFLCEVALGNMYELKAAQNVILPSGKHSVRGIGRYTPATDTYVNTGNDVTIPIGKLVEGPLNTLQYDEFIVYDQSQVKLRYVVFIEL